MISFDDIKPGKLLVWGKMLIGKRTTLQINSYPQELETEFTVEIIREEKFSYSKYRNLKKQRIYLTRKDLLKYAGPLAYRRQYLLCQWPQSTYFLTCLKTGTECFSLF